jgi:cytochrome P450
MTTINAGLGFRGPSRWATPRLLWQLSNDRLRLLSDAAERYGDATRIRIGPKTLYFFNRPDLAKHVLADNSANYHKGIGLVQARRALGDGLLTSEGELWREQRKVVQPAFQSRRIAASAGAVAEEAAALVARLRTHVGAGPIELVPQLTELTLGVLGRTLLETDLSGHATIGPSFEAVQDQAMFEMVTMGAVPEWVPLPRQRRFRAARRRLAGVVNDLVAARRERDTDGSDVLSRLIASTDREADRGRAERRLRDELVTLLLAGHETTASTLGWTFYLLDRHPEVCDALRAEVRQVLGDRLPEHADLPRLRYTTMVVEEAMRLYPPVWILTRTALADDDVGGHRVPAGADVVICPYTLHRHPDFWERPELFDPDRFSPAGGAGRPRYAYLPFGAGPRFCVGSHLGMMEAVFVTALVVRELRLAVAAAGTAVAEPMLSLRLRGGLPVYVRSV